MIGWFAIRLERDDSYLGFRAYSEHGLSAGGANVKAMSTSVILYSKPGCHLCEEAKVKLERLRAHGYEFAVEERDISADPALFARFQYIIPVVEVDGRTLEAPISEYRLERLLNGQEARG